MYTASPSNGKKRRKRRNKPICKRRKRKSRSPSGRKMTDCTITKHFGLVLSHRERCWFVWQQQTMAQEAQKTWHRQSAVFQLWSLKCFIAFFLCVFVFLRMCYCYQVFYFFLSKVLEHYDRNLNAAFVKYIKICNVTKPFLCIRRPAQHLHENKTREKKEEKKKTSSLTTVLCTAASHWFSTSSFSFFALFNFTTAWLLSPPSLHFVPFHFHKTCHNRSQTIEENKEC